MSNRLSFAGMIIAVAIALVGCSSAPAPSATATPHPSVAPARSESAVPSSLAPSVLPSVAPTSAPTAPPSAAPSRAPSAAASLRPDEVDLLNSLRADSQVDCQPRRSDLPPGAVAGIECHPNDSLVSAVGVYAFSDDAVEPALNAYLARLASAKVAVGSGDCATGHPGDHAWPSNLPDVGESGSGPSALRAGCFLDENGIANIRVTCYADIYIGVLGASKDLKALNAWTWKIADGESTHRDPPGICARPD
jgi:hypothetical protein